jgi:hypothetical protein
VGVIKTVKQSPVYKGVCLSSRYDLEHEYDAMRRAVDAMPELMARRIESIWCDSKACACYTIMFVYGLFVPQLPDIIDDAFRAVGGHNGITFCADGHSIDARDPWWPWGPDDEEYAAAVPDDDGVKF